MTAPGGGLVMATVGGVMSLKTVTVTALDENCRPRMSRATAVNVCVPLLAVFVSHGTEYGADVSAAPRFAPSSLNWTLETVRLPIMVTLAETGTVPPTVAPCAGDVIDTIRLPPNCAEA